MNVLGTSEFESWFLELPLADQKVVDRIVGLLRQFGLTLGAPHSSAIKGSNLALRELRPNQGRSPLRIIYAFDANRDAIILVGGDKGADANFYKKAIRAAEELMEEHAATVAAAKAATAASKKNEGAKRKQK